MRIHATSIITPSGALSNSSIVIDNGVVVSIHRNEMKNADVSLDGVLIPAFVDIHCHGGGGFYFSDSKISNIEKAIKLHHSHGTSTQIVSLVTAPLDELKREIGNLIPLYKSGAIAGIHLEGPYLSSIKCGAHDPALLRRPEVAEIQGLLALGEGAIKMITVAPELEGALDAIKCIVSNGAIAAIGHTDADGAVIAKAVATGASVVTHFNNAMRKLDSEDISAAEYLLREPQIPLEIILDRVHVSDVDVKEIYQRAGKRIVLVTDAMSASGCEDGNYLIGDLKVIVENTVARLVSNGALAGSTLTMDRAFLNAIDVGFSIEDAVLASSTNAARLLQLPEVGSIEVGARADFLLYNPSRTTIERVAL